MTSSWWARAAPDLPRRCCSPAGGTRFSLLIARRFQATRSPPTLSIRPASMLCSDGPSRSRSRNRLPADSRVHVRHGRLLDHRNAGVASPAVVLRSTPHGARQDSGGRGSEAGAELREGFAVEDSRFGHYSDKEPETATSSAPEDGRR